MTYRPGALNFALAYIRNGDMPPGLFRNLTLAAVAAACAVMVVL